MYLYVYFECPLGKPEKKLFFLMTRPLRERWGDKATKKKKLFFEALTKNYPKNVATKFEEGGGDGDGDDQGKGGQHQRLDHKGM